jgi:molybdate transport system substrate-binding protein
MKIPRRLLLGFLSLLPLVTLQSCGSDSEPASASAPESTPKAAPGELNVYAAASLKDAIAELNAVFERDHDAKIVLNAGSSGTLSVQIEQGGECDVFFSAGDKEMDRLDGLGLVDKPTRRTLLSNQLVIVVPKGEEAVKTPEDLKGDAVTHLSLANVDSVPAGRYAKEWLQKADLWTAVEGKVLPGNDVRAALSQVEFGGAEAGIIYRTDAALSEKVSIAYAVPVQEGPKISYPIAAMTKRPNGKLSAEYVAFLGSDKAKEVFQRYGFLLPEAG